MNNAPPVLSGKRHGGRYWGAVLEPVRSDGARSHSAAASPPALPPQSITAVAPGAHVSGGPSHLSVPGAACAVNDYIPIRQREKFRLELYAQDCLCFWCRTEMDIVNRERITPLGRVKANDRFASFEHLVPKSEGGRFTRTNIRLAHAGCNRKRRPKRHHPRYAHDPLNQRPRHEHRRSDPLPQRGHTTQAVHGVPDPTAEASAPSHRSHNPERERVVR
jgi:hypothetical protein